MEYRIDDLLDEYLDDSVVLETIAYTSADKIKEMTMNQLKQNRTAPRFGGRKRLFSVALAAALVFALSITAFAVYSIHQQRQASLRELLQVDANNVESYVEYNAEGTEAVTLLSAIRDGSFQKVYVNVSPVTEKEVLAAVAGDAFYFTTNHTDGYGMAQVPFDSSKLSDGDLVTVKDPSGSEYETYSIERIKQLCLQESYDKETQTLTLELNIWDDAMNGASPVAVTVVRMEDGMEKMHTYGTVTFTPTAAEIREIRFAEPVELYNASLQESCRVIGVRLTPMSAVWLVEIENAQELFGNKSLTKQQQDELISWLKCTDLLSEASLVMSDGSVHHTGMIVADPYENGFVMPTSHWTAAIDVNAVVGAQIGDTVAK